MAAQIAARTVTRQHTLAGFGLPRIVKHTHFHFPAGAMATLRQIASKDLADCDQCPKGRVSKRHRPGVRIYSGLSRAPLAEQEPYEAALCAKCWEEGPNAAFFCDGCNEYVDDNSATYNVHGNSYVCRACAESEILRGDLAEWLDRDQLQKSFAEWPIDTYLMRNDLLAAGWVEKVADGLNVKDKAERATLRVVLGNLEDAQIDYTCSAEYGEVTIWVKERP